MSEMAIASHGDTLRPRRLHRLRYSGETGRILILGAVLLLAAVVVGRPDYQAALAVACAYAVAATGLGVALGLAGEYVLAQVLMFTVGAYGSVVLTATHGWSYWPAALLGTLLALLAGLVVSLVGLRISRFYFAMIGFFIVLIIPDLLTMLASQTGGEQGLASAAPPSFFGVTLGNRGMFVLGAVILLVTLVFVRNVRRSPLGVEMRRMRDAPAVTAASGTPPWRVRMAAYAICSGLAGLGGVIYGQVVGYLLPDLFDVSLAILFFAAVLVGGRTTLLGPTVGVVLLYLLPQTVLNVAGYSDLIAGGMVLIAIIGLQGGVLASLVQKLSRTRTLAAGSRAFQRVAPGMVRAPTSDAALEKQETVASGADGVIVEEIASILMELRTSARSVTSLTITGVCKRYGAVAALDLEPQTTVEVKGGTIHLLLGPNGSGKTTLLNAICGFVRIDRGQMRLGEQSITGHTTPAIARAGVARSFQSPTLPAEVTPRELLSARISHINRVRLVHWLLGDPIARRRKRESDATAEGLAVAAGLGDATNRPCVALTSGQRRITDVLAALTSRSQIVLLDEPAAGLSPSERTRLADTIRALSRRGVGFLVVEHDLDLALGIADTVTVLDYGRVVAQGTSSEIRSNKAVRSLLMGDEWAPSV